MIVDAHTHTPTHARVVPDDERVVNTAWRPDRAVLATTTWDDYVREQSNAGVDVSIVFNIAVRSPLELTGLPGDPATVNDATAQFVAADPARRIGFLSVHPEDRSALEEVERCVDDLGMRGIKLGPNYQNFDPLGASAERIYAEAERRRLPIIFHQGTSPIRTAPLRYAHPLVMDEIAIRHPELRIVMAHLGHPWQADTFAVIRKHPHVYADVSGGFFRPWSFYSAMRLAAEWGVLDKLLFASDYPVALPLETIAGLRAVNAPIEGTALPRVPDDAVEGIIRRDTLALLRVEPPPRDSAT
jgi:predicted TIM-barrel fold metal-dependent hydrolase